MHDPIMEALKKKGIHLTLMVDGESHEPADGHGGNNPMNEPPIEGEDDLEQTLNPASGMSDHEKSSVMAKKKPSLHERMQKHALSKKMGAPKV